MVGAKRGDTVGAHVVCEGDRVAHGTEEGAVGVCLGWSDSGKYLRVRWDHLDGFIGVHRIGDLYRVEGSTSATGSSDREQIGPTDQERA